MAAGVNCQSALVSQPLQKEEAVSKMKDKEYDASAQKPGHPNKKKDGRKGARKVTPLLNKAIF